MTNDIVRGEASAQPIVNVEFGAFKGPAAVRQRDDGREVAFIADAAPTRFPLAGEIDGAAATATARMAREVRGVVVLWVPDAV